MAQTHTTRRRLAALRSEWRYWRNPGRYGAPIDVRTVCPTRCGECEACAMTAYRADRLAEVKARAAMLTAREATCLAN